MSNIVKQFLLLMIIPCMIFSQSSINLVGSWQAAPHVAAGYDDTFTFDPDGTFYYFNNQMDCGKREVGYGGNWELKGKTIQLTITYTDTEKGGWYEPSDGSCGGDSMLVGSTIVKTLIFPYDREILSIANYKTEKEDDAARYTIEFNKRKYWYFTKFEY